MSPMLVMSKGSMRPFAQVRHFTRGTPIDLSKIDWEKKLDEILAAEATSSRGIQAMRGGQLTTIGVDEEEEGAETPVRYLYLS